MPWKQFSWMNLDHAGKYFVNIYSAKYCRILSEGDVVSSIFTCREIWGSNWPQDLLTVAKLREVDVALPAHPLSLGSPCGGVRWSFLSAGTSWPASSGLQCQPQATCLRDPVLSSTVLMAFPLFVLEACPPWLDNSGLQFRKTTPGNVSPIPPTTTPLFSSHAQLNSYHSSPGVAHLSSAQPHNCTFSFISVLTFS